MKSYHYCNLITSMNYVCNLQKGEKSADLDGELSSNQRFCLVGLYYINAYETLICFFCSVLVEMKSKSGNIKTNIRKQVISCPRHQAEISIMSFATNPTMLSRHRSQIFGIFLLFHTINTLSCNYWRRYWSNIKQYQ